MSDKIKPVFNGKIINGKLLLDNRYQFDCYIQQLQSKTKPETPVKISISKILKNRSTRQNAYYWACLNVISQEISGGETSEQELHETFKARFLSQDKVINGKKFRLIPSTTKLNTLQFSEYMDKIFVLMGEFGITLPTPDNYEII